jgi:hypothetical protein
VIQQENSIVGASRHVAESVNAPIPNCRASVSDAINVLAGAKRQVEG